MSKVHETVEKIEKLIEEMNLKKGDRLPSERELCERTGASRIIVREALSFLKASGIIKSRRGSGNYIVRLPREKNSRSENFELFLEYDIDELVNAREFLDKAIAEFCLHNFTLQMIEDMERFLSMMKENYKRKNFQSLTEADIMFHKVYIKAARNPIISSLAGNLLEYMKSRIWYVLKKDYLADSEYQKRSIKFHEDILNAIVSNNKTHLLKAIENHYKNILDHLSL
ncbi:FadR/GntR family transcriptional regulator [Thermotoga sp. KOL6]|uniref:FadR/GntR family transcriptional regulator n=1 Tax=Thermotoga sp. KOL6 TaxID=126741 RepID=UPI000C78C082|nr:FCD domain-containing protein [Thermotoga sp. KOL6]PLV59155.1 hypothetical protein AS005_05210 [Thermotoga sp. KOL6]